MKKLYTAIARLGYNYDWLLENNRSPKAIENARKNYEDIQSGVNELQKTIKNQQKQIEELELKILFDAEKERLNNKIDFLIKYAALRGLNFNEVNELPLKRVNDKKDYKHALKLLNSLLNNNEKQKFSFSDMYQVILSFSAFQLLSEMAINKAELISYTNLLAPAQHNIYFKIN